MQTLGERGADREGEGEGRGDGEGLRQVGAQTSYRVRGNLLEAADALGRHEAIRHPLPSLAGEEEVRGRE